MITGQDIAWLLLTLAVGYAGARVAQQCRIPAVGLLGPIVAVGGLHMLGIPLPQLGREYRYVAQVLVGATVASTLTPAVVAQVARLFGPTMLGVLVLIVLGVASGWALHVVAGVPLASALFAGAPGGAAEMALAAGDLGGDVELVAALHIVRSLIITGALAPLLRWLLRGK